MTSDFSAGGAYDFDCAAAANIALPATITPGGSLTVTDSGAKVVLEPLSGYVGRFMIIDGQSVSLSGIGIEGWVLAASSSQAASGANGANGVGGTDGTSLPIGSTGNGGNGTSAVSAGGAGGDGSDGSPEQGGALLIDSGTVNLSDDTISGNVIYGQSGGNGGVGGNGGGGGHGGNAGTAGVGGNGGSGGSALPGGNGGNGGNGSSAEGGAIYNAGTLTITDSTLNGNRVTGGNGGLGGNGGTGGSAGYGGHGYGNGNGGNGGNAADSGSAGSGGSGGNAEGGAIYNTGTLTITGDTFSSNSTWAGAGGAGGNNTGPFGNLPTVYAGDAGPGGQNDGSGVGGNAGSAGSSGGTGVGGSGGMTAGGALFDRSGTTASGNTFTGNTATGPMGLHGPYGGAGGVGSGGGIGAQGGVSNESTFTGAGTDGTAGADGGAGGNGGTADGGAFVSPSNIAQTSVCSGNSVVAGIGGAGGAGGFGGSNAGQLGGSAPNGAAGAPGANGAATNAQSDCADSLTVTIAAPSDGGGPRPGLGATVAVSVTVTAPAANHDSVTGISFTGSEPVQWTPAGAVTSSDDSPPSAFSLAPGSSRTVTVHLTVAQLDTIPLASAVSGSDPGGTVTASGSDTLYTQSSLQVTVSTDPDTPIKLQDTPDGWVAQTVDANVTVKNVGGAPVTGIALESQMVITVAHGTPQVGEIPIDQPAGGPTPSRLGTLAPGQSAQGTYALNVRGDGTYDLAAVVDGTDQGGQPVSATGDEVVEIDGPVLVWKASLPNPNALIKAGSTFLVNVTLQNNSYQKTVAVGPMHAELTGNAQDGHVQLQGEPIPDPNSAPACDAGEAVTLAPRTSEDMDAVIRTASSDPELAGAAATAASTGTRAEITFADPAAWFVNGDGSEGAPLDPATDEVIAPDSQDFVAHIDDRGFPPQEPRNDFDAEVYFSKGTLIGAGQALVGLVHGVFVDIPKLIAGGILGFPHALLTYEQLEADLWNDVKDNPAARAAYTTAIGNAVLLAFKNAPALEQQAQQAVSSVDAAVLAHYTRLWTQWYAGDWKSAAETMGEESGDAVTNLGLLVAPCVLAKLPAVNDAFQAARAAAYTRAAEELSRFPAAVPWLRALAAIDAVVPGLEFTNRQLLSFAGLTIDQSDFLRSFAEAHDYLIVARTRAAEAVGLLKEGLSVLKPELIKTKTVSQMDIDFLGYSQSELAQVVLRDPPSPAFVDARLRSRGFTQGDATWDAALQRLAGRVEEEKYTHQLEELAQRGEVTMRFNLAGNAMDPAALDAVPTTYRFRLAAGPNGDRIPQFFVSGRWRSVTGDVDFLQITHADGTPLSTAERAQVYREFSSSPVGMLHGESATWQDSASQAFAFPKKIGEFTRAGTVVQFGPDGKARAVRFVQGASEFHSESKYYVPWQGGYVFPATAAVSR